METKEKIPFEKVNNAENEDKCTKKISRKKKQLPSFVTLTLKTILIAIFILIACIILLVAPWKSDKARLTTISKSSLQKMVEIDELSTIESPYNAVVTKYNKKNKAMYHVAYEGIVTAGVDASKIDFEVDEEKKIIKITLPKVKLHSTSVDMGTMQYIFTDDDYETETVSQEAYKLCKADLEKRAKEETALTDMAKENAISCV